MAMGKPFSMQAPEDVAKEYGGNKQNIAKAAQMGLLDPTTAVMAGMFIDRMREAQAEEQQQTATVAEQVFSPQPAPQGMPAQPPMPQGMSQSRMPQGMSQPQMTAQMPRGMGATPQAAQMQAMQQKMAPRPSVAGMNQLPMGPGMIPRAASGGLLAFATGGVLEGVDVIPYFENYGEDVVYGEIASKNAEPFAGIIFHDDIIPGKSIEARLNYYGEYDAGRKDPGFYGYHFAVDNKGNIYQTAPLDKRTNHFGNPDEATKKIFKEQFGENFSVGNKNTLGVTYLGNEDGSDSTVTPEARKAVAKLTKALRQEFNIPTDTIISHAEATQEGRGQEGVEIAQIAKEAEISPAVATQTDISTQTPKVEPKITDAFDTGNPDVIANQEALLKLAEPTTERPPVVTNQTVTPNNVVPGGIVGDVAFEAPPPETFSAPSLLSLPRSFQTYTPSNNTRGGFNDIFGGIVGNVSSPPTVDVNRPKIISDEVVDVRDQFKPTVVNDAPNIGNTNASGLNALSPFNINSLVSFPESTAQAKTVEPSGFMPYGDPSIKGFNNQFNMAPEVVAQDAGMPKSQGILTSTEEAAYPIIKERRLNEAAQAAQDATTQRDPKFETAQPTSLETGLAMGKNLGTIFGQTPKVEPEITDAFDTSNAGVLANQTAGRELAEQGNFNFIPSDVTNEMGARGAAPYGNPDIAGFNRQFNTAPEVEAQQAEQQAEQQDKAQPAKQDFTKEQQNAFSAVDKYQVGNTNVREIGDYLKEQKDLMPKKGENTVAFEKYIEGLTGEKGKIASDLQRNKAMAFIAGGAAAVQNAEKRGVKGGVLSQVLSAFSSAAGAGLPVYADAVEKADSKQFNALKALSSLEEGMRSEERAMVNAAFTRRDSDIKANMTQKNADLNRRLQFDVANLKLQDPTDLERYMKAYKIVNSKDLKDSVTGKSLFTEAQIANAQMTVDAYINARKAGTNRDATLDLQRQRVTQSWISSNMDQNYKLLKDTDMGLTLMQTNPQAASETLERMLIRQIKQTSPDSTLGKSLREQYGIPADEFIKSGTETETETRTGTGTGFDFDQPVEIIQTRLDATRSHINSIHNRGTDPGKVTQYSNALFKRIQDLNETQPDKAKQLGIDGIKTRKDFDRYLGLADMDSFGA